MAVGGPESSKFSASPGIIVVNSIGRYIDMLFQPTLTIGSSELI